MGMFPISHFKAGDIVRCTHPVSVASERFNLKDDCLYIVDSIKYGGKSVVLKDQDKQLWYASRRFIKVSDVYYNLKIV